MMKRMNCCLTAITLSLGLLGSANAAIITFEGFSNTIYNSPITRSGFDFGNVAGDEQHFHEIDSTNYGLISNGTGILLNDRDSRLFAALNGGGSFLGNSIDVASSGASNLGSGDGILIEGFLNNVSTGILNISFGISSPFQTVNLGSLGTVDRLVFDGIRGGFELDNAIFNEQQTVPEPASLGLLGIGLAGLGATRRRKTA
jgi:hypothetical protein